MLRAVNLLSHQLAMPSQDGVRFDDGGDFIQRRFTKLLANFGQGAPLSISELDPAFNLVAQDTIFRHQILNPQAEQVCHHGIGRAVAIANP